MKIKQGICAAAFAALASGCAVVPYNNGYTYAPVVAPVRVAPAPVYVDPFPLWGFSYYSYRNDYHRAPTFRRDPWIAPPPRHYAPPPRGGHWGYRR